MAEQHVSNAAGFSKSLLRKLKKQLEFYFSDSNLQKDRYLRGLVESSSDGYVALQEFMKFNRVREMTDQVEALKFALQFENEKARSDGGVVLELNRDKTAVRRTNSIHFEPADDVDERTLYIECLPPECNDRLLRSAFAHFGAISYVSVPKFNTSGQPCGFAFVEFRTQQAAQTAVATLTDMDGYRRFMANLPKSSSRLQTMASLAHELEKLDISSLREQKAPRRQRKSSDSQQSAACKAQSDERATLNSSRKRSLSENGRIDVVSRKSKRSRLADCESGVSDGPEEASLHDTASGGEAIRYFVVCSKKDWLRRKDLEAFREEHRERSRLFRWALKQVGNNVQSQTAPSGRAAQSRTDDQKQQFSQRKSNETSLHECDPPVGRNLSEKASDSDAKASKSVGNSEALSGTIVRFYCQTGMNKKLVKAALAAHANDIAYIEVLDGANFGYIRVKSPNCNLLSALGLCNSDVLAVTELNASTQGFRFELLSGDEEAAYCSKIANMRDAKAQRSKGKQNAKRDVAEPQPRASHVTPSEPHDRDMQPSQNKLCLQRKHIIFSD